MRKTTIPTFYCYFVVGSNRGYDKDTHISREELSKHLKNHQTKTRMKAMSLCLSDCEIIFEDYSEKCYKIEAINYPRFPLKQKQIIEYLSELCEYLIINLGQQRITLVTPTDSILFGELD